MISFNTDVQPNKEYSITIDTDRKEVFDLLRGVARALTDNKYITVTVSDRCDVTEIYSSWKEGKLITI